jgi:hypothetical protein
MAAAALAVALVLAVLGLAACGGSSTASTATVANAAAANGATGPGSGRFEALRTCLQQHGIKLAPRRPRSGTTGPGGPGRGFFGGGGGPQLPPGVTQQQFQTALRACGGGGFRGGASRNSPAFRTRLAALATCMRHNGINLPPPNTSGTGPIFNTSAINTGDPKFQAAYSKCRSQLAGPGGPGGPGAPGAPTGPGGSVTQQ